MSEYTRRVGECPEFVEAHPGDIFCQDCGYPRGRHLVGDMIEGEIYDVFDPDVHDWLHCKVQSVGEDLVVFEPTDRRPHPGTDLRMILGIPWPMGQELVRPCQRPGREGHL